MMTQAQAHSQGFVSTQFIEREEHIDLLESLVHSSQADLAMMTCKAVRCPVCGRMSCWVEVPVRGFARIQTECRRCRAKFEVEVKGEARGE